jgi:hypothetical protein
MKQGNAYARRAPTGRCLVCLRPDAQELLEARLNGASAAHLARQHGINRRVMANHFLKHCNGALAHQRGVKKGAAALAAAQAKLDTLAEAQTLYNRTMRLMAKAEQILEFDPTRDADAGLKERIAWIRSQGDIRQWIAEAGNRLEMIARLNGELSTGSQVTVINQLGVRIEDAKAAVDMRTRVEAMSPREKAEAALRILLAWNDAHPDEPLALRSDGPTLGESESRCATAFLGRELPRVPS